MIETVYYRVGLSLRLPFLKIEYEHYTPSGRLRQKFSRFKHIDIPYCKTISAELVADKPDGINCNVLYIEDRRKFETRGLSLIPISLQPNGRIAVLSLNTLLTSLGTKLLELTPEQVSLLQKDVCTQSCTLLDNISTTLIADNLDFELHHIFPIDFYGIPDYILELYETAEFIGGQTGLDQFFYNAPQHMKSTLIKEREIYLKNRSNFSFILSEDNKLIGIDADSNFTSLSIYIDCNDFDIDSLLLTNFKGVTANVHLDNITLSQLAQAPIYGNLNKLKIRATIDELLDPKNSAFIRLNTVANDLYLFISLDDFQCNHEKLAEYYRELFGYQYPHTHLLISAKEPFNSLLSYFFSDKIYTISPKGHGLILEGLDTDGIVLQLELASIPTDKYAEFIRNLDVAYIEQKMYEIIHADLNDLPYPTNKRTIHIFPTTRPNF